MDFFKSVFSDDPQPSGSPKSPSTAAAAAASDLQDASLNSDPTPNSSAWSFGDLIKNLASKSESVIETYRRDFEEFGSGLKKEAAIISEAVDIGATVAQESLESVGQAIDNIGASVWKSTAQIISHGRDTLLTPSDHDLDHNYNSTVVNKRLSGSSSGLDVNKPYNRFENQVRALQCDESTYCTEPEDKEEYDMWREGFPFDEKEKEIEDLISDNGVIADIYRGVVPGRVADSETFWSRYFYRLHKLKQAEDARARLVKRAMEREEEEDLSWDFYDDDEEENNGSSLLNRKKSGDLEVRKKDSGENETIKRIDVERNDDKLEEEKADGKMEGKEDNGESSCKDSDDSIVSSQPSMPEEEDLGWDEIEDVGSNYESKGEAIGSASKADLRKRLSAAEEEEDLCWDIEDDDHEPVK